MMLFRTLRLRRCNGYFMSSYSASEIWDSHTPPSCSGVRSAVSVCGTAISSNLTYCPTSFPITFFFPPDDDGADCSLPDGLLPAAPKPPDIFIFLLNFQTAADTFNTGVKIRNKTRKNRKYMIPTFSEKLNV